MKRLQIPDWGRRLASQLVQGMLKWRGIQENPSSASMIGIPPSARPAVPIDHADHAADFAARYAEPMNYLVEQRMVDLGIPPDQIGSSDRNHGIQHATFMWRDRIGGSNGAGGRLTVDSGIFNSDLMAGLPCESEWRDARLRNRLDAIIAHEYEEARDGSHENALERAPTTELPISEASRKLLHSMRPNIQDG
jgi:hypothetical protein